MEKKDFKVYEAPAVEVVEVETSVSLLAGSPEINIGGGEAGGMEE